VDEPGPRALEPGVTFAAHRVHGGFLIDRLPDGRTGRIDAAGWSGLGGPGFVVRAGDAAVASLRVTAPAAVGARAPGAGPELARVEPRWEAGAVRFTVTTDGGAVYRSGPFVRPAGEAGAAALARTAQTNLDLRGVFRADLLDGRNAPVGWLEVRLSPSDGTREFEGAVPRDAVIAGPLLVVALDSEIDWIEGRAIDVYRGTSGGRDQGADRGR
jgi:hypothetical protein